MGEIRRMPKKRTRKKNASVMKREKTTFDNIRNYKSHDRFGLHEYKKQIIEAEAYNAGDKAVEIFKILTSK